jgi:hypothetical protein
MKFTMKKNVMIEVGAVVAVVVMVSFINFYRLGLFFLFVFIQ